MDMKRRTVHPLKCPAYTLGHDGSTTVGRLVVLDPLSGITKQAVGGGVADVLLPQGSREKGG